MGDFAEKVIDIIQMIPAGRVMTYGQIAWLAGSPRSSRQVGRILHSMSRKYLLPWHRVINVKGKISLKNEGRDIQKKLLEAEGVGLNPDGSVDLAKYQWKPDLSGADSQKEL